LGCAWQDVNSSAFVNVAWDGAVRAYQLETLVAAQLRQPGTGTELVAVAAQAS
jgi:hypothetical protein